MPCNREALIVSTVLLSFVFIVSFIVLLVEVFRQRNDYDSCRSDLRTTTALILGTSGASCANCLQLQLKYVTGKVGEVVAYLLVSCTGNLCTNSYVTGNNILIHYKYDEPGKPYLVKPECHYDVGTEAFYISLGFMIASFLLICLVYTIVYIKYHHYGNMKNNDENNENNKNNNEKESSSVPHFDDNDVYFIDEEMEEA